GPQSESQLRLLYSRAAIYAGTSRYEPSGMAILEAALSRCALILNDIPSLREIWGPAAVYFRTNDADSLAEAVRILSNDPQMRRQYGFSVVISNCGATLRTARFSGPANAIMPTA